MAEFRKIFYALGLASLLVGASSTAMAAVQCTGSVANPPIIREESFTELVGDIILDCTGGTHVNPGVINGQPITVLPINVTITVSAPVTSGLLSVGDSAGGFFNEALLIIDEPNHPHISQDAHNARPLLACGDNEAVISAASAPYNSNGVCDIVAVASTREVYNGTSGHPNVFQGRQSPVNTAYQIIWNGVPFDPPGQIGDPAQDVHRTLRFTNIRVASPSAAPVGSSLTTVFVEININGQDITLTNRVLPVASVQKGIDPQGGIVERKDFLQCETVIDGALNGPVIFREGFASAFKVRGWGEIEENGAVAGGIWQLEGAPYQYSGTGVSEIANQLRQNVPGGIYFTESGFNSPPAPGWANPGTNAPVSTGTAQDLTGGVPITNTTGVALAGVATNGTRIILTFKDVPAGSTINAPATANLVQAGTSTITGIAVRTSSTLQRGDGAFSPVGAGAVGTTNRLVYEILFSRSQIREDIVIPLTISYSFSPTTDQPEVNKTALVSGGFAPFQLASDNFAVASQASATVSSGFLPIPRFVTQTGDQKLYSIIKCSCNLLFPFTTNATTSSTGGNFDTGIAIANTSLLPNFPGFVQGTGQQGGVQFWYFPALSTAPAIQTQCANTVSVPIGACDGTRKIVKAGETLTYILSQNDSTRWGLDNRAKGFTGYIIAQTQFQYCHAFAYISPEGAFPLTNGMSVGYLALILDKQVTSDTTSTSTLGDRTTAAGEALNH